MANCALVLLRHQSALAQVSLAFRGLRCQYMASVRMCPLDLSGCSLEETLLGAALRLHLWHQTCPSVDMLWGFESVFFFRSGARIMIILFPSMCIAWSTFPTSFNR